MDILKAEIAKKRKLLEEQKLVVSNKIYSQSIILWNSVSNLKISSVP